MNNSDWYVCPVCGYTVEYRYPTVCGPPASCPFDHYPRGGMARVEPDELIRLALKRAAGVKRVTR